MQDLIRFIWRGALGGAIVPSFIYIYYMMMLYGSSLFWVLLIISLSAALPGAVVGATLWFLCVRFVESLGTLLRITIGVSVGSTITALWWIYSAYPYRGDFVDFPRLIFWILFNGASIGVFAGWLCPAATVFRKEAKLTYWERVREYEAAQAEREHWLAQLDSEKSRKNERPT
jgi:hypothetical protein